MFASLGDLSNDYLGTNFDTTVVRDGKRYMSNNKDFNDDPIYKLRADVKIYQRIHMVIRHSTI